MPFPVMKLTSVVCEADGMDGHTTRRLEATAAVYSRTVSPEPLRLRLLNDYEVVVAGLRAMIEPLSSRLLVVEEDLRSAADRPVDITLYDTFGTAQADRDDIAGVLSDPRSGAVVIYSWNVQPDLVRAAIDRGCRGYLDKSLPAADLVSALERVGAGETVVELLAGEGGAGGAYVDSGSGEAPRGDWPGRPAGLSPREAEVVALITQGLTNDEIASRAYISVNSLKSYIRSAYRKMGVSRRSQAVRWGIENGMLPAGRSSRTEPARSS